MLSNAQKKNTSGIASRGVLVFNSNQQRTATSAGITELVLEHLLLEQLPQERLRLEHLRLEHLPLQLEQFGIRHKLVLRGGKPYS